MTTTLELLAKIKTTGSPVLRFEFMPRHRAWIAIHTHGFQSQVTRQTVDYFGELFGTKIVMP